MSKPLGVWVLGNEIPEVEKCIPWHEKNIPNFADCGTLIVDMSTLDKRTIHVLDSNKAKELFEGIQSRVKGGGEVICLFKEMVVVDNYLIGNLDNYFWSPIRFSTEKVKPAKSWRPIAFFQFKNYLEQLVKEWDVVLELSRAKVQVRWNQYSALSPNIESTVTSHTNEIIAGTFGVPLTGFVGKIHMIPVINDSKKAISFLLKDLGIKDAPRSKPPLWTEKIRIPNLDDIERQISDKKKKIENIEQEILELNTKKVMLDRFKELLFASGPQLEEIVKESLHLLGITSIQKGRQGNYEDLVFYFESDQIKVCTIEVKGLEGNLKLADARQALQWALDYEEEGNNAKALLIVNLYRLEDISISKQQRESFKDVESLCQKHDICILPTTILFDLVLQKLEGKKIDIKEFEKLIITTRGVLNDLTSIVGE